MSTAPVIDVVIPTVGRESLRRAVASVRRQTSVRARLHVVVDSPTARDSLSDYLSEDEMITTGGGLGGAKARNLGLAASTSRYVAYLDDDDWWDEEHLANLLIASQHSGATLVLGAAVFHSEKGSDRILPASPLSEPIGDYAVFRPRLKFGHGLVQSSCILVDRETHGATLWDATMPKHQDWDYVLRLVQAGATIAQSRKPLAHIQQGSASSVSRSHAWRASAEWYERHRHSLTGRGRGDFIAAHVLRSATATRDIDGIAYAARQLVRYRPHAAALAVGLSGLSFAFGKLNA